jgi:hypothetical protein
VLVQVRGGLGHASVVGGQHRPACRRVTHAIEDGHALGWAQDHVEGRHRALAMGATEQLAAVGMAALEHALEPGNRCFAL